jgi:hypothetical protein
MTRSLYLLTLATALLSPACGFTLQVPTRRLKPYMAPLPWAPGVENKQIAHRRYLALRQKSRSLLDEQ